MAEVEIKADDYFEGRLKIILEELLPLSSEPPIDKVRGLKVIHDNLWGSRLFYPWEIALIDTPLLQRLRRIYQLGTAFLTYPSAVHSRFSHSLGVAILSGRLIARLKEKVEVTKQDINITKKDIYTVRAAGLLHDIGHCFLSHTSEMVLKKIVINEQKKHDLGNAKPHEFFSYLILNHETFVKYWEEKILPLFNDEDDAPDPKDMAKLIVGKPISNEKRYLQEIIHGPYDVDKLEYLFRDAKMAGLEISYDIERFFYKIQLFKVEPDTWRLTMDLGGVRAVEQIIFSKMMLFSFVYHHQKVLAADALVADLLLELLKNKSAQGIVIDHPLDFLKYTDSDLLSSIAKGPTEKFENIRNKLINRLLPKRCFVVSKEFVENLDTDIHIKNSWDQLKEDLRDFPDGVRKIREDIVNIMNRQQKNRQVSTDDLFIVFPTTPSVKEPATAPVVDADGTLKPMDQFFQLEGWQKTYELKKLRGFFFTSPGLESVAAEAVEQYLREERNLTFKPSARAEAKCGFNSETFCEA